MQNDIYLRLVIFNFYLSYVLLIDFFISCIVLNTFKE